jgi:hypothetical protein
LGSALPYVGYQVAKQIPNLVGAVGTGALVPEVAVPGVLSRGASLLPRALGGGGFGAAEGYAAKKAAIEAGQAFAKQTVGGLAFNEGQAIGSLYQSAKDNPEDKNPGMTAILGSPLYAASETLPEAMLMGRLATGGGFSGNLLNRIGKNMLAQGASGATSELTQTKMELAVGKPVSDAEARSQYLNAGVAGGLVEGLLGGFGGLHNPRGKQQPADDVGQAITSQDKTSSTINNATTAPASSVVPPAPPVAPAAQVAQTIPVVNGGTTAVAQGAQTVEAENNKIAEAQKQQAARDEVFEQFNVADPQDLTKGSLFGKPIFGRDLVNQVGDAMVAATADMTPVQVELAQAVATANAETGGKLVSFNMDATNPAKSVGKALESIGKVLTKYQIGHVQTAEEAGEILNTLSEQAKGQQLDQINAIHFALTGEDTVGYEAAQTNAKGATNGQQQVQNPARVGAVRGQGSAGEASSGVAGAVRPSGVQPVQPGGQPQGPLSLQAGQPAAEGVRSGSSDSAPVVGGAVQTPQIKPNLGLPTREEFAAWASQHTPNQELLDEQNQTTPAATTASQGEVQPTSAASTEESVRKPGRPADQATAEEVKSDEEKLADQAEEITQDVMEMLVPVHHRMTGGTQAEKAATAQRLRDFMFTIIMNGHYDSLEVMAADFELNIGQAKDWSAKALAFKNEPDAQEKLKAAFVAAAEKRGLTINELLSRVNAKASQEVNDKAEVDKSISTSREQGGPRDSDERRLNPGFDAEGRDTAEVETNEGLAIKGRKSGESIQERYNAVETNQAKYMRLTKALEEAENSGDEEEVTRLNEELAKVVEQGTKQDESNKRRVRNKHKVKEEEITAPTTKAEREPDTAEMTAAAAKWKSVNGDLTKLTDDELKAIKARAQKFNNKKLTADITAELEKRGVKDAVQEQSTGEVDVRQQASNGEGMGEQNAKPEKPARKSDEEKTQHRVTFEGKAATLTVVRNKATPEKVEAVTVRVDGERLASLNLGSQGTVTDEKLLSNLVETDSIDAVTEPKQEEKVDEERFEREMRANASTEQSGDDVKTTALRYVPFAKALEIAKKAVAEGVPVNWVQFHNRLDLTADSAKRLVEAINAEEGRVKTSAEQWGELAMNTPGMPDYDSLNKDQKIRWDDLASRGVANLAAASKIVSDANTASKPEKKTVTTQVEKLAEPQIKRLEQHYGEKRGTDSFLAKVTDDIVAYASKGAEAVSAAIRDIVKALANGVMAFAMIVNPNMATNNFKFDLPKVVQTVQEERATVPDAAKAEMSDAAQRTYEVVAPVAKAAGKWFMITDKVDGKLHVFDAEGNPVVQTAALTGRGVGDKVQGGNGVTPAGKFTMQLVEDHEYYGGYRYDLVESYDGNGVIAVHAVWTGEKSEKRPERLASKTAADNRISWGCINTSNEVMMEKLVPNWEHINGSLMFVMPENPADIAKTFPAKTVTKTTRVPGGLHEQGRTLVAKEETDRPVRFSKVSTATLAKPVENSTHVANLRIVLDQTFGVQSSSLQPWADFVQVHATPEAAFKAVNRRVPLNQLANAQGFVDPRDSRVVHLIASNIQQGDEVSVLIHELGVHVGLKQALGDSFKLLEQQVLLWKHAPKTSPEYKVWEAANARVVAARLEGAVGDEDVHEELVAYAAEEAVRMGFKPSKNAANRLEKFLQSLKELLEKAFQEFFKTTTLPSVGVQDLVDFSFAATASQFNGVRVEPGAQENAPVSKIMHFYAATDQGKELSDTAMMEEVEVDGADAPGQEQFYWGDDSKYGNFHGITTDAFYNTTPEGMRVMQMVVTSEESRNIARTQSSGNAETSYDDVLQTIMLTSDRKGHVWDLVVQGPDRNSPLFWELHLSDKATELSDTYGTGMWTRLEGIPMRDTMRALVEARRRLTRLLGGRIPRINFVRVTGSGMNLQGVGRQGGYRADEVAIKFSKAAPRTNPYDILPDPIKKKSSYVTTNLADLAKRGILGAAITEDVVNMAKKFMASAETYLKAQYARQATRLKFELRIDNILSKFDRLADPVKKQVNEFIADSTSTGKWGYIPTYGKSIKIDDAMKARFDALPAAAKRVVEETFEHGYEALKAKQSAVKSAADREFKRREQDAAGDQGELAKIAAERRAFELKFDRLLNIDNNKPYAYMGRYGDYVVVAKSAEYREAEELSKNGDLDAAKWLAQNQSDGSHYYVAYAESMGEAKQMQAELDATGQYEKTYAGQKLVSDAAIDGGQLFPAITRLSRILERTKDVKDAESVASLERMLGDLYLAVAAEASSHKSSLQRKNIAGFDRDMMRNLATRGRADASFLASIQHNEEITDALEAMRKEQEENPEAARPFLNELLKRHAQSLNYQSPSVLSTTLTRMSNIWFLATNPAFYLQQMVQTAVLSQPYLAGRLGYFRSGRLLKKAYADVAPLVKGLSFRDHVDFSKAPADVRAMLDELVGMGKIDLGIDSDAKARAGEQNVLGKVMYKLQGVNTRIETINRAVAAIAAYRGYLDRYGSNNKAAATKFAAEVVSNTHGSYDGFNTPRFLSSNTGRVFGQFKRFQIIQLSMLAKLIHNSFNGASKEEKAIARRALAFIGGHMAVLGGALGVPFVSQIAWMMSKLFGDPDEPDDYEFKLRRMIGDESMANLLLKGVPAYLGVDLSGKLAMQNVASILPFNEGDLASRSGMEKTLVAAMGPGAALTLKFADSIDMMSKGNYYKGLEQALPNGVANAMKGARFATEGVTMRNGDLVLGAEDVSLVDAAFQAVGLPTDTFTSRQRLQNWKVEFDDFYNAKTTELKQEYTKAHRDNDTAGMSDVREEWNKLQESRRNNGYKTQPLSTLIKAPQEADKRGRNIEGGVEFNKQSVGFGRQYANI